MQSILWSLLRFALYPANDWFWQMSYVTLKRLYGLQSWGGDLWGQCIRNGSSSCSNLQPYRVFLAFSLSYQINILTPSYFYCNKHLTFRFTFSNALNSFLPVFLSFRLGSFSFCLPIMKSLSLFLKISFLCLPFWEIIYWTKIQFWKKKNSILAFIRSFGKIHECLIGAGCMSVHQCAGDQGRKYPCSPGRQRRGGAKLLQLEATRRGQWGWRTGKAGCIWAIQGLRGHGEEQRFAFSLQDSGLGLLREDDALPGPGRGDVMKRSREGGRNMMDLSSEYLNRC